MCGLFGYWGAPAPPDVVAVMALQALQRGPHAHGWVALGQNRERTVHRCTGPVTDHIPALPADAVRLVGHCRLATAGGPDSWSNPDHAGPRFSGRFAVAHNGNVYGARSVVDSDDILGEMMAAPHEALADRLRFALGHVDTHDRYAVIALDVETREMVVVRRHLPLYITTDVAPGIVLTSTPAWPTSRLLTEGPVLGIE